MHPASPATTVFDSVLFRDAFGTPSMREVFSDRTLIGRYVEVEIALAKAEAKCGVIPVEAADAIARQADASGLDLDVLRQETDNVGYPILPLVHQLRSNAATPAVTCIGVRRRRISWTRQSSSNCAKD